MTTEKQDRERSPARKPLPEEPELVQLWRVLVTLRDDLVVAIERWESPNHPIAEYQAKVVAVRGAHGLTDRRLRELDEQRCEEAEKLGTRLAMIDREVAKAKALRDRTI
jgi:hypothetical protein